MLRTSLGCLLAALAAFTPGASDEAGDELTRCNISARPGIWMRAETILLAEATNDTVLAGPGGIEPSLHGGHTGPGGPGPIHGQVFDVEGFSGADSARLARAFGAQSDARALIVPWDYDEMCQPAPWTRGGAAWVPSAEHGTFTVRLRPDSLWIEGMPVFDAFHAVLEPFPSSKAFQDGRSRMPQFRSADWMAAEDYFALMSALLPWEDVWEHPDSTWRTFLRWQRDHPDLVQLYPANMIEVFLGGEVSEAKARRVLRSIDPVISGTWRMAVSLDGEPDRTFYMRTRARPFEQWPPYPRDLPSDPFQEPDRPTAYSMVAQGAPALDMLPTSCREPVESGGQGYVYVIDPPTAAGERRDEWRGWIEAGLIARQFPRDTAYAGFHRRAFDEWSARRRASGELEAPAFYSLDTQGTLRVEQTTRLENGRTLVVRGERIDDMVVSCDD